MTISVDQRRIVFPPVVHHAFTAAPSTFFRALARDRGHDRAVCRVVGVPQPNLGQCLVHNHSGRAGHIDSGSDLPPRAGAHGLAGFCDVGLGLLLAGVRSGIKTDLYGSQMAKNLSVFWGSSQQQFVSSPLWADTGSGVVYSTGTSPVRVWDVSTGETTRFELPWLIGARLGSAPSTSFQQICQSLWTLIVAGLGAAAAYWFAKRA